MNDILREIEKKQLKDHKVSFSPGDTLKVHVRIKEGDKERVQVFQGIVIGRRGSGVGETFTVRKMSAGVGVERIFPLHSPNVVKIERIREGSVRRAKLYYLRGLSGKSARITEKKRELESASGEAEAAPQPEAVLAGEAAEASEPVEKKK
jgi:large subunit ribosomal protein L19